MRALLLVPTLFALARSSCFTQDAKWKKEPPRVSQVSKTDPSKVMVDWSNIIKHPRCVDKYFLWVWQDGQTKGQGKKYSILDKNTQTKTVDIQPCVFYNFRLELEEDDSSHKNLRPSETAKFNSAALPKFNSSEVLNYFTIGYMQDPVSKQFDLTKASIKFDTKFLTFASCIKHIEVTGKQKSGASRLKSMQPAQTTPKTTTTEIPADGLRSRFGFEAFGGGRNLGGLGGAPSRRWGSSQGGYGGGGYNPGHGGSNGGFNPGQGGSSGGGYNPGHGSSSGGGYNPGHGSSSGGGYNPGHGSSSGGGYNPGHGSSSGGGYNPGHGSGHGNQGGYNPGNTQRPPTTTWGYNPSGRPPTERPGSGWSYPPTARPPISTTRRPSYNTGSRPSFWGGRSMFSNQFLRMTEKASTKVGGPVKASPPFRSDEVEIVIPVEPCEQYVFEMRIINPQNKEIGKISDLELETLADVDSYIPPPLTSVILVDYINGGKYVVKTQPNSPVPQSCLPDYMEALDAYANRLETVANEQSSKNKNVRKIQFKAQKEVELTQADMLVRQGCICASPRLELKMVSPQDFNSPIFGVYLYEGMLEGKPYYKLDLEGRSTGEFIALQPMPSKRSKRFIGRVDGGGTTTTRKPWNYGGGSSSWSSSSWSSWSSSSSPGGSSSSSSSWSSFPSSNTGSSWTTPRTSYTTRRSRYGGTTTIIPIQRVTTPAPKPALLPRYIYWEKSAKQWLLSPKSGAGLSGAELAGSKNSKLACPADGPQTWSRSQSNRMAEDSSIQLSCSPIY